MTELYISNLPLISGIFWTAEGVLFGAPYQPEKRQADTTADLESNPILRELILSSRSRRICPPMWGLPDPREGDSD